MSSAWRLIAVVVATTVAFLAQVVVMPHVLWAGVAPGLVLLVVVATALGTDTRFATLTGFAAGLLLDLAPPAEHAVGRWALALLVVGYVVGRLSHDHQPVPAGPPDAEQVRRLRRPPTTVVLAAVAGGSFVGTSTFALTGFIAGESAAVSTLLSMVAASVVLDVVAGLPVVLLTLWFLTRHHLARARGLDLPRRPAARTVG
jgi:hypothetical protein